MVCILRIKCLRCLYCRLWRCQLGKDIENVEPKLICERGIFANWSISYSLWTKLTSLPKRDLVFLRADELYKPDEDFDWMLLECNLAAKSGFSGCRTLVKTLNLACKAITVLSEETFNTHAFDIYHKALSFLQCLDYCIEYLNPLFSLTWKENSPIGFWFKKVLQIWSDIERKQCRFLLYIDTNISYALPFNEVSWNLFWPLFSNFIAKSSLEILRLNWGF